MKKAFLLLTILFFCVPQLCQAQKADSEKEKAKSKLTGKTSVTGRIIDGSTTEYMPQVTIQLLELPDTTFVYGMITDNEGWFTIKKVPAGEYLLRYSFMGYSTVDFNFKVLKEDKDRQLGVFKMYETSIMLSEAVIEETLPPTQVVDDTLMFNVSAFRVPEGSVLEELIKRLPGVEVDENGNITVNGRTVTRILVDGQEYFGNDRQMATKNLPVNIIHRIKTYQRKSDLARITGIDDGEDETVMDLEIKPNMRNGWLHNIDGGIGKPVGNNDYGDWIKYLWSGRYTLNRFQANTQLSVNANTQNSGQGNGISYNTQIGVNFSKNIGEPFPRRRNEFPLVVGGNVRYNGSTSRSINESESETFATTQRPSQFRNNDSNNNSGNGSVNGEFRMEWRPDSSLNIIFRPSFQISKNNNNSNSRSVTFNADPHLATDMVDILDEFDLAVNKTMLDSIGLNSQKSHSHTEGSNNQISGEFQFNKRFNDLGRNFTVRFTFGATKGTNDNFSYQDQRYYQSNSQTGTGMGGGMNSSYGRDTIMNRYNASPTDNSNWSGRIMWSEPIDSGRGNLQLSYQIQVNNRNQNRETYVFSSNNDPRFVDWYDTWFIPENYEDYRDDRLSRSATNVTRNHTFTLQFRYSGVKSNFNLGVNFMPQYTGMDNFQYMGKVIGDTSRVVYNWSPSLNYTYRWNRQQSLQLTFRTNTSQPSMEDMMDITDDSNPMNIRKGNPGLLPTLRNTVEANYQNYIQETQKTINLRISLENSLRNISQKTDYDPSTGISITQPQNMDGFWTNWSTSMNLSFNQTIPNSKWRYSTTANAQFRHQESFMRTGNTASFIDNTSTSQELLSVTESISAGENGSLTYRNDWFEATINGRFNYSHSDNSQRQGGNGNMDTYTFSYGGRANARLPWRNLNLGTDLTMQSRRGYSGGYNRNDLIWNANASISFLKGNAGTLQIQYYDILNDESNVNRSVSTTGRTDTKNNNIHSYIMLHFILRVNVFGNRAARQEMRQQSRAMMGGGGMRGGFGGPGGGGFGGNGGSMRGGGGPR
ncbi:MAG: TonB-dependent receptor [Bacteroidaceae bacterium]|nr:TonB-dependent receptor [Bacteroidaceae bacterium]